MLAVWYFGGQNVYILIAWKTMFFELHIVSLTDCWNYCYFGLELQTAVKLALNKFMKFCSTALDSSVFGKVRELVGDIECAFDVFFRSNCLFSWFSHTLIIHSDCL